MDEEEKLHDGEILSRENPKMGMDNVGNAKVSDYLSVFFFFLKINSELVNMSNKLGNRLYWKGDLAMPSQMWQIRVRVCWVPSITWYFVEFLRVFMESIFHHYYLFYGVITSGEQIDFTCDNRLDSTKKARFCLSEVSNKETFVLHGLERDTTKVKFS